jgi:hypothetical protein
MAELGAADGKAGDSHNAPDQKRGVMTRHEKQLLIPSSASRC